MYTKLNEDTDQLGGVDASTGNEGQKLVWGLQDIKLTLNDKEIEAPQLLAGYTLDDSDDEKARRKKDQKSLDSKAQAQISLVDKFEEQRKHDNQTLYREREVQSLRDLIYGSLDTSASE